MLARIVRNRLAGRDDRDVAADRARIDDDHILDAEAPQLHCNRVERGIERAGLDQPVIAQGDQLGQAGLRRMAAAHIKAATGGAFGEDLSGRHVVKVAAIAPIDARRRDIGEVFYLSQRPCRDQPAVDHLLGRELPDAGREQVIGERVDLAGVGQAFESARDVDGVGVAIGQFGDDQPVIDQVSEIHRIDGGGRGPPVPQRAVVDEPRVIADETPGEQIGQVFAEQHGLERDDMILVDADRLVEVRADPGEGRQGKEGRRPQRVRRRRRCAVALSRRLRRHRREGSRLAGGDDLEVTCGERCRAGCERRELDRRLGAGAVGIEQQRASGGIVEDPVARIGRGAAEPEGAGRERAAGQALEHPIVEQDPVRPARERFQPVDIAGAERRVEHEPVASLAAVERVVAEAAPQRVVARSAAQHVGGGIAGEDIGEAVAGAPHRGSGQDEVFEAFAEREGDGAPHRVGAVIAAQLAYLVAGLPDDIGVVAVAAAHAVIAAHAVEPVVAVAAQQDIVRAVALQAVAEGGAGQPLDRDQGVEAGASGRLRAADRQAHRHARRRVRVSGGVDAGAAVEPVVARTAFERVHAIVAMEELVADAAGQPVAAGAAMDRARNRPEPAVVNVHALAELDRADNVLAVLDPVVAGAEHHVAVDQPAILEDDRGLVGIEGIFAVFLDGIIAADRSRVDDLAVAVAPVMDGDRALGGRVGVARLEQAGVEDRGREHRAAADSPLDDGRVIGDFIVPAAGRFGDDLAVVPDRAAVAQADRLGMSRLGLDDAGRRVGDAETDLRARIDGRPVLRFGQDSAGVEQIGRRVRAAEHAGAVALRIDGGDQPVVFEPGIVPAELGSEGEEAARGRHRRIPGRSQMDFTAIDQVGRIV